MSSVEYPVTPEQLLEHTQWVEALARSLVRDDATAEDVVQETWLAALRRPPRFAGATRSWLARVVRNLAKRAHREEARRIRRERLAARPEHGSATPDQLLQWAELQCRIVDAVSQLSEPYRSTVLLRFFAKVDRKGIAERQGISVSSVGARLNTALGLLRTRLDDAYGRERQMWCSVIVLALGLKEIAAPAATGAAAGSGVGATAATAAAAGNSAFSFSTIGGIAMTHKTALAISLTALVAGALGVGIGRTTAPREPRESGTEPAVSLEVYEDLRARHETAVARLRAAEKRSAELEDRGQELGRELAALHRRLEDAHQRRAAGAEPRQPSPPGINWSELGKLISEHVGALAEAVRLEREGTLPPEELKKKLGLLYGKIKNYGLQLKSLSDSPLLERTLYNNLVAALLEDSLQLSEGQLKQLSRSNEAILDEILAGADPAELLPLERYRLRRELVRRSQEAIQGILEEHQVENWEILAPFSGDLLAGMFGSMPVRVYGLQAPGVELQILEDWQEYFLTQDQADALKEPLKELASNYVQEARAVVERYGTTEDEIQLLPPDLKERMHDELLEIQEQSERSILPFLKDWQRDGLPRRGWAMIRRFSHSQDAVLSPRTRFGIPFSR